jgi:ABC-type phosphate transport system substrate-binding protein
MGSRKTKSLFVLVAGMASCGAGLGRPARAQGADTLVMVVNRNNLMTGGMNLEEARRLLLGETASWRNGSKVVVVLKAEGNADRAAVLKKVCGMSESAYTRFEMQASFTGQTPATVELAPSDAAVKNTVKTEVGAIGFIHKSQVDDSVRATIELQ